MFLLWVYLNKYLNKTHINLKNYFFIKDGVQNVEFLCPKARSNEEQGGLFSILVATLLPYQNVPQVVIMD
jgi:hypothetical protein